MNHDRVRRGPQLPPDLQEQLKTSAPSSHSRSTHSSRKEERRRQRLFEKQRKAQHFSERRNLNHHAVATSPSPSKRRKVGPSTGTTQAVVLHPGEELSRLKPPSPRSLEAGSNALRRTAKSPDKLPESAEERREEQLIAYLENKLARDKWGRKPKKAPRDPDGLDDLLTSLDRIAPTMRDVDSDASYDLADETKVYGAALAKPPQADFTYEAGSLSDAGTLKEPALAQNEDEALGTVGSEKTIQAPIAYRPPHLRHADDKAATAKLSRIVNGLLNRLTESNIGSIVTAIEALYQNNTRHDVSTALINSILNHISSNSLLSESYIILNAALISCFHKCVGVDVAAQFVQQVVEKFEEVYRKQSSLGMQPSNDKAASNLSLLLSHMYTFKVVSCVLVYDVIRMLLNNELSELNVELLLRMTQACGRQLRDDDPSALKGIVNVLQTTISTKEHQLSLRTRFMVETLTQLSNKKEKARTKADHVNDLAERLRKFTNGLSRRQSVHDSDALNVSLHDLQTANTRGKWWLVGSGWAGDPLAELDERRTMVSDKKTSVDHESGALSALARKQGMNTDVRRGIFVALMGSEDYLDACEHISQLSLTELQQREIIRVILHCCGNEKGYNPFYCLVAEQLCKSNRSYQITLQFCLWDFFRALGESDVGGTSIAHKLLSDDGFAAGGTVLRARIHNVARLYSWLVHRNIVTLAILKGIDLGGLQKPGKGFLRVFFAHLFASNLAKTPLYLLEALSDKPRDRKALEAIFLPISRSTTIAQSLLIFLRHNVEDIGNVGSDQFVPAARWSVEVAVEVLSRETSA